MQTIQKLLSFRYKKNFILNKKKLGKLNLERLNIKTAHHDACPMCGCSRGVVISEVDRVGFICDTVVCDGCELVFNNTYISNPHEFYAQAWGDGRWGDPESNFLRRTSSDSYSWKRMAFVANQLGEKFKTINRILEIGCGDGCNLLPYHLIGKEVMGCDFDNRYLEPGRSRGMNLVEGGGVNFTEGKPFDLVMLIHAFEHMINLDACVKEVSQYMSVGGYVYVEVPGIFNLNQPRSKAKKAMGLSSRPDFLGYLQFQHNYHLDLLHTKHVWERNGFEMVAGDEWVRCLFRKVNNFVEAGELTSTRRTAKVIDHLTLVEQDFFTFKTLASAAIKRWILN